MGVLLRIKRGTYEENILRVVLKFSRRLGTQA